MKPIHLAALALLGLMTAQAGPGPRPTVADPLPFDHGAHAKAFDRGGVSCVDCHPVGMRASGPLPRPSLATCHGCHLGELPGAPRRAERTCDQCHPVRGELIPASHGPDWMHQHGPEARARKAACQDCHETRGCVDCHASRGALQRNPHPPGFRTLHGVEARLDPMRCSTCHSGAACRDCHTTGAIPW